MEPDYPAAHSMDTTWYAVDQCGHVAVFDTGEDGAIPQDASCKDEEGALYAPRPFAGELDRCLREKSIVPGVHATKVQTEGNVEVADGFYLLGLGLKADPGRILKPEVINVWTKRPEEPTLGTADGRDWIEGRLSGASWTWLHGAPHRCLGCVQRLSVDAERRLEELRFFRFSNSMYGKYPYEKELDPYNPGTLEDLRRVVTWPLPPPLVFPAFCFREKKLLQPLQWVPCFVWGDADVWTDEDQNERKGGAMLA